ncbi:glycolate oxidase subunit GlcE [Xanthobacter sp. ZOL 2024]
MPQTLLARDPQDVVDAVNAAGANGRTLEIRGTGSLTALGRPVVADTVLDLSALSGITLYEPEELVLSARCGTPRRDIEDMLAQSGQMLAFEPADLAPLFGGAARAGSLGGLVATNLAGPRRISAGAVRDHTLGLKAVSGRGELFKSGGRVVKNVTGYDLPRLFAGAFGTLGVATEITLKVLPRPETQETLRLEGLAPDAAAAAMSAALGSSCEVSGAAYAPARVAVRLPGGIATGTVMLRLEGVGPSVEARRDMLARVLAPFGPCTVMDEAASSALWAAVRDVSPFVGCPERALWRLSTAPMAGPALAARLCATLDAEAFCDWGGGLIWLALPGPRSEADTVRTALAASGGHATLLRATAEERARTAVFQPLDEPLAALTARVKSSFDPAGLLNRGRMHEVW